MADYGVTPNNYNPDIITYSGQIGKIAKQIIETTGIKSKFDTFEKEPIEYGKDIEITIFEEATGVQYDPDNPPANVPNPKGHTLLFKTLDEQVYPVKINSWEIDKAVTSTEYAEDEATKIVDTLYNGDRKRKNEMIYNLLNSAASGAPNPDGSVQIVAGGSVPEVSDEASAKQLVILIKTFAAGMREDAAAHNPYALDKGAERVVLVIPYQTKAKLDVYLFAGSEQPDYLNYGVNEVLTVPAAETDGAIYLVDDKYIQMRTRKFKYAEEPIAGNDTVKAYLLTSRMYAACPFYTAVKITQSATPESNGILVKVVNGDANFVTATAITSAVDVQGANPSDGVSASNPIRITTVDEDSIAIKNTDTGSIAVTVAGGDAEAPVYVSATEDNPVTTKQI